MADDLDELPNLDDAQDPDSLLTALDAMLDFLREKVVMPAEEFYALEESARARAFTVSGVADLDLVTDVWEAIDQAVTNGETLADFRERVGDQLEEAWGQEDPWRLETIFRTNVQTAYSAGRQSQNAAVRETHPYIRYDVVDDGRTSDICLPLLDVVVPADSSFAASHHPPLHFNCRTDEVAITKEEAHELGVTDDDDAPEVEADEGFGTPLEDYEPDLKSRPAELASIYELKTLH